jgi:hypothetical protein
MDKKLFLAGLALIALVTAYFFVEALSIYEIVNAPGVAAAPPAQANALAYVTVFGIAFIVVFSALAWYVPIGFASGASSRKDWKREWMESKK